MDRKLFIFGLDAAPPSLLFKEYKEYLPNFSRLIDKSICGELRSCDPPITIPAWMVMMTGHDPGELGLYGFRHRKPGEYDEYIIPTSKSIKPPRVWDILGEYGYRSVVIGVPPTYPPTRINGYMISCFLTPSSSLKYTYPLSLRREVEALVGKYIFDVPFRREDRDNVLNEIFDMTHKHIKVVEYLLEKKPWNLFIYMEIGLDRVQHAFWKYMDINHPRYVRHEKYGRAILEYYTLLDEALGRFMRLIGDDTAIMVVSDHGAKMMKGAFAINDWLIDEGLLVVRNGLKRGVELSSVEVDWGDTLAWGWGGYYARIFLNIKGRERDGVIEWGDVPYIIRRLRDKIKSIRGPEGEPWINHVYTPSELYGDVRGHPPDLIVYLDDLYWRSAGTLGYDDPYLPENDTGPDDAVHDYNGVFVFYQPDNRRQLWIDEPISITDIMPTILKYFGIDVPPDIRGSPII